MKLFVVAFGWARFSWPHGCMICQLMSITVLMLLKLQQVHNMNLQITFANFLFYIWIYFVLFGNFRGFVLSARLTFICCSLVGTLSTPNIFAISVKLISL